MSIPNDAFGDAFQKAFGAVWKEASVLIMSIMLLLSFCAVLAIWIEWKTYGHRN